MPPPRPGLREGPRVPSARPWAIVTSVMVTSTPVPEMSKMRKLGVPLAEDLLMVSRSSPRPTMTRLLVMASSPLISVIVRPASLGAKVIVLVGSPLVLAVTIAARSELGPLSALFLTVSELSTVRSSRTSSLGTEDRRWGGGRRGPGRLWYRWELQVRSG